MFGILLFAINIATIVASAADEKNPDAEGSGDYIPCS